MGGVCSEFICIPSVCVWGGGHLAAGMQSLQKQVQCGCDVHQNPNFMGCRLIGYSGCWHTTGQPVKLQGGWVQKGSSRCAACGPTLYFCPSSKAISYFQPKFVLQTLQNMSATCEHVGQASATASASTIPDQLTPWCPCSHLALTVWSPVINILSSFGPSDTLTLQCHVKGTVRTVPGTNPLLVSRSWQGQHLHVVEQVCPPTSALECLRRNQAAVASLLARTCRGPVVDAHTETREAGHRPCTSASTFETISSWSAVCARQVAHM
jgi:hypothetical protein